MFSRKWLLFIGLSAPALVLADLPKWLRFAQAGSKSESALFRAMNLPAGPVLVRNPPKQARADLSALINATSNEAELYTLRAHEAEVELDFTAAEADWKKYVSLAENKLAANIELADYYHRRLQVTEEMAALREAARQPNAPATLFTRMLDLSRRQLLPFAAERETFRQWSAAVPADAGILQRWIRREIEAKQYAAVDPLLAEYAKRFPNDPEFPLAARAELERARGNMDAALAVYDRGFTALDANQPYFALLREARAMRQFLNKARAAAVANPQAIDPVARQVHYWLAEGNPGAARQALSEYRRRKEAQAKSWTAAELYTVARLWQNFLSDPIEAARHYYALYSLAGAPAADQERALAGIVDILLTHPENPPALGTGDLTYYRDIASADPYPGLLNGILSLLLNSTDPPQQFAQLERQAVPYFARAKAAELLALLERRFPQSAERAGLRAKLLEAYAIHGQDDAVLQQGTQFLTAFPDHDARTRVQLAMADAHARKNQVRQEIAVYDALLLELGKKAGGVPLGEGIVSGTARKAGPRSPEYARVLDRYVSRLVALKRPKDALVLMRREIDRNPNDPGLYERLATFLDQNKLAGEIEAVYRRAMTQFADRGWHHKLARFYLRQKQTSAFQALTLEIVKVFEGTELEQYFRQVVPAQALDGALYRQVNLAAWQRFPHNLTFVRNLLDVYQRRGTANPAEYEKLLRRYWFYDAGLQARFFAQLQRTGKLGTEMAALATLAGPENPAAARMLAEAEAWRSHYEQAADPLLTVARQAPGDEFVAERAAMLARSLAAREPKRAIEAAAVEAALVTAAPRQTDARIRLGELHREYPVAVAGRDAWDKIPDLEPGDADHYLEAATVHWDYFEYADALRIIGQGRTRLNNPALYAYEAGAIYENQRRYPEAIAEYAKGALAQPGGSPAQSRLIRLARRPNLREAIDQATAQPAAGASPAMGAVALRIALLEQQNRGDDLSAYLNNLAAQTQSFELLARVETEAQRLNLPAVQERALTRQIELTPDPVDQLRMRVELVRFYERQRNLTAASRLMDTLQRENPNSLGILRAAVNYHWRNRNTTRAVDLLRVAATSAHESMKGPLQFEAARKATESGQAPTARQILTPLLAAEPYNPAYLAAFADTYARERDDRSLRAFYQDKIAALQQSPLSAADKLSRVAAMRRALIPVLERSGDTAAAVDQYIEVINRYAEDQALLDEAAAFAKKHDQQARLTAYYDKTAAASPRDARWPLVLARLHTSFENFDRAIEAYTAASKIRPERTDWLIARGNLEERLLRFDEAAATFAKVYELTYRNSQWMERVAEIRARQGRNDDAVAALRTAFLEGRTDAADGYFEVARRLEQWALYDAALPLAERGVELAGAKLLEGYREGAMTYARLMTRARRHVAAQAKAPGGELLLAMAPVVKESFTAQEKMQFSAFLDSVKVVAPTGIGVAAGMASWDVRRLESLLLTPPLPAEYPEYAARLRELQAARLDYAGLGRQMEAYAKLLNSVDERRQALQQAAEAWRASGSPASELRVLSAAFAGSERYLELLAQRNPDALIARAGAQSSDEAVRVAIESGKLELALAAVAARGQKLPPVWTSGYTALTGMYYGSKAPTIEAAFRQILGGAVIGDVVGKPVDRKQQLAGDTWFYYGGRFAEYLDLLENAQAAADYRASILEASPGRAGAYVELGDYLREAKQLQPALSQYELALELQPKLVDALHGAAAVEWALNRREAAKARWALALDNTGSAPELLRILDEIVPKGLRDELRAPVERALVRHVRSYGAFQLEAIARHLDVSWIVAASRSAFDPLDILRQLANAEWIQPQQKETLLARMLEVSASQMASTIGDARANAEVQYWSTQAEWIEFLITQKQAGRARAAIAGLDQDGRERLAYALPRFELLLAAQENRLAEALARLGESIETYQLREVAQQLQRAGDAGGARVVLREAYERELRQMNPPGPAPFLGLAEVLLEAGDTAGAVTQLRRMTLLAEPAFAYQKDAVRLFRRFGKTAEAQVFAEEAVKATPWDVQAQSLARASGTAAVARTLPLLEAHIQDNPYDSDAKLEAFRPLRAANRHTQATNAMEAVLRDGPVRQLFDRDGQERESIRINEYWVDAFLAGRKLTDAQRAAYARELGDSLVRTGRLPGAVLALEIAQKLQPRPQTAAEIARHRAELSRRERNRERRPQISPNLDQPVVVRPMLTAANAAGGAGR
jgi:tetratricopeptide (TPR) repeat protein